MELQWDEGKQELFCYLPQDIGEDLVSFKMIEHNQIPGLLPIHWQYIDDQIQLIYEVQGYRSLQSILEESGSFSVWWVCRILRQIIEVLQMGERFFLSTQEYYLVSEYIYLDRNRQRVRMCYLPGEERDTYLDLRNLMETLMKYLDHRNKEETGVYYALYQMYSSEEISVAQLQEHLERCGQNVGLTHHQEAECHIEDKKQQEGGYESGSLDQDAEGCRYCLRRSDHRERRGKSLGISDFLPEEFSLKKGVYEVGRQQDQRLLLLLQQISRKHAILEVEPGQVYVTDQDSANGTFVNGRKISAYVKTRLAVGDVITFADISYQLQIPGDTKPNAAPRKGGYRFGRIRHALDDFRLKCPLVL